MTTLQTFKSDCYDNANEINCLAELKVIREDFPACEELFDIIVDE